MNTVTRIIKFDGMWSAFSNFSSLPDDSVTINLPNGQTVSVATVEHGYQASKAQDLDVAKGIVEAANPVQAKKLGQAVKLSDDEIKKWDRRKQLVMLQLLTAKFTLAPLAELLDSSSPAVLVEGNYWHDNYWGSCLCPECSINKKVVSYNFLGQMLMFLRDRRRAEKLGFSREWATWRACVAANYGGFDW